MRKKYYYLLALLTTILVYSCNKDQDKGFVKATVRDSGDITNQGCGYLLVFEDGTEQKPYQLLSAYQHNGMLVKVKYHFTDIDTTCGTSIPYSSFNLIIVDDIKRDLD